MALALVKKLNVTPEDNATSQALAKAAEEKRAELGKLDDAAFDKAYVDNEVAYHQQVNGALETLLIPSTQNAELKSLLESGLKLFQGHPAACRRRFEMTASLLTWRQILVTGAAALAGDTVEYYCRFHPNMKGRIKVVD
jgi:predicted outer membrane protein